MIWRAVVGAAIVLSFAMLPSRVEAQCAAGTIAPGTVSSSGAANSNSAYADVNNYKVYAFSSTSGSNSITFAQDTVADVLVVGGGGGGAGHIGAGGGAGAVIFYPGVKFNAGTVSVTVGAGGTAGTYPGSGSGTRGVSGGNSSIGSLFKAIGGGGGGVWAVQDEQVGFPGGSSGGNGPCVTGQTYCAAPTDVSSSNIVNGGSGRGSTTSQYVQGNKGGGITLDIITTGGGGGAGAAGRTATAQTSIACGLGGAGASTTTIGGTTYTFSTIFGSAYTTKAVSGVIAGGGGGGGNFGGTAFSCVGGAGGGGTGLVGSGVGTAGTVNTGSGGGGGADGSAGAAGGSGLILIRYALCQPCSAGTVKGVSDSVCQACSVGSYSTGGTSACSSCGVGTFAKTSVPASTTGIGVGPGTDVSGQFVHAFYSSGSITFAQDTVADVLVVGGGGGGGGNCAGGGGAGTVLFYANYKFLQGALYTLTVGGGGPTNTDSSAGKLGTDSKIVYSGSEIFVAKGGGGGGVYSDTTGKDGGSGGGGGGGVCPTASTTTSGGSALTSNVIPAGSGSVVGKAGGAGQCASSSFGRGGGGGGGAGQLGQSYTGGSLGGMAYTLQQSVGQHMSFLLYLALPTQMRPFIAIPIITLLVGGLALDRHKELLVSSMVERVVAETPTFAQKTLTVPPKLEMKILAVAEGGVDVLVLIQ